MPWQSNGMTGGVYNNPGNIQEFAVEAENIVHVAPAKEWTQTFRCILDPFKSYRKNC